jgi:hypothetical protein
MRATEDKSSVLSKPAGTASGLQYNMWGTSDTAYTLASSFEKSAGGGYGARSDGYVGGTQPAAATPIASYDFGGTLAANEAGRQALAELAPASTNDFVTDNVFGVGRQVYSFDTAPLGGGLWPVRHAAAPPADDRRCLGRVRGRESFDSAVFRNQVISVLVKCLVSGGGGSNLNVCKWDACRRSATGRREGPILVVCGQAGSGTQVGETRKTRLRQRRRGYRHSRCLRRRRTQTCDGEPADQPCRSL